MRMDTSVCNVCQHNYFCIQHCHIVNSTQISDDIKRLRFDKSDGIDNLYSDNFKHGTGYFCHVMSWICTYQFSACCCYTNSQER